MKKGIKTFCKVLSVFLAVLFVIEILPLQVMAEEFTEAVAQKEFIEDLVNNPTDAEKDAEAEILYEVEEKRDEHTKVYKKSDGTYTAIMTEEPLHYLDEGVWKEIDNSMILDGSLYTNLSNLFNVELPKNIDEDKELTVEKDGYELSFNIDNIEDSSAVIENDIVASDTEIESADKAIAQTQSSVTYSDIADNTDLQYIVTPNSIKENIIVSNKESVKETYTFTFETNGLNAEKQENNSVLFKDNNGDVIFTIPCPVMTDANFAFSYDIGVSLTKNANGTVTLEYAPSIDWTSNNDRVYPITIDPAIAVGGEEPDFIEDTGVGYNSDEPEYADRNNSNEYLVAVTNMLTNENSDGTTSTLDSEVYTKIDTDFFKNLGNDIVFTEVQYIVAGVTTTDGKLFAREITGDWDVNTVTYNAKPELSSEIIDYYSSPLPEGEEFDNFALIHFNITEIFNEWFNGKDNKGFAITAAEGTLAIMVINGGSENTAMVMDYVDLGGYNENLNYHSQSAGRAGTGYVNDFTQHLSVVRDDLSIDGNVMPVTVGMIYDTATYDKAVSLNHSDILAYGNNWIPNYLRVFLIGDENQFTYYTDTGASIDYKASTDEDGNVVFTETYSDIYGEHGYEIEYFAPVGNQPEYVTMTRPDGYVERFNRDGLLVSVKNPDYPEQSINVVYDSRARIDYITDGVGRRYNYIYDTTTNLLSKVKCYSANGIAITAGTTDSPLEVSYTYDEYNNLETITFPDEKSVIYTYENGNITSMTNIDGYRVVYGYDSNGRVTTITEQAHDGTDYIDGNSLAYERLSSTQIKLTDGTKNFEIYHFGIKGNLLYSVDNFGNYFVNDDSGSTDETYFISSSDYRVNSQNLLKNPSFEEKNAFETGAKGWTVVSSPFERATDENAYFGDYVLKTVNDNEGVAEQIVPVLSGGDYTLSAYVKSNVESGQKLNLTIYSLNGSSEISEEYTTSVESTGGEWQRYIATITAPEGTEEIVIELSNENGGTFSIDNIQLEQSLSASSYNYLTDGGFRKDLDYWTGLEDFTTTESSINGEIANAVTLPGGTEAENIIYQTVTINGKKDDVFTVGGWLKGYFVNSVTNNTYLLNVIAESSDPKICNFTNDRYAQIEVSYQYTEITGEGTEEEKTETLTETIVVPFAENVNDWQFATQDFALKGDCKTVTVLVRYSKNANSALISNIELSKNEDTAVSNDENETTDEGTDCVCENCEELICTCVCESEALCSCFICKRSSDISTTDSFGNITSNSSFDGVKIIETVSKYTGDGNYLEYEKDADGNKVSYFYDSLNGVLEAVTDANGNKITYSYDANGKLTQVSADNSLTSSAKYVYNNEQLIYIIHNDFAYQLSYDLWNQLSSVVVGKIITNSDGTNEFVAENNIISYKYGSGANRDRILEFTYYNASNITGTTYKYQYKNGNVNKVRINGVIKYEYEYDSFGNLISVSEINSRTVKYTDNRTDIIDYKTKDTIYSSFTNDEGDLIETIGGITYTSKSYNGTYDIATGITTEKSDVATTNGKTIGIIDTQDWFNRYTESIVKTESADDDGNEENNFTSVKTEYTYPEYDDNKTSNRVESYLNTITYGTNSKDENRTNFYGFAYDYDNNGNIIAEYKQGINGAKTLRYSYVYDELNQLVRVNDKVANTTYVYDYDGAGNITKKYEYIYTTDEEITAEPENVILYTYDEVWKDKLATYNGKEFTYDNIGNPLTFDGTSFTWSGRELTTYSKDGKTISFQYDENGLRHRKMVTENGVITEQYDYVWSDGSLISQIYTNYDDEVTTSDTARFIYDSWGTLQGFILNDSETYLYVKNLQGDIIAIVDEKGQTIVEYSYDAWGNVTFSESSLQNMTKASTLCFVSPFTYRGYCYDYDIELYYLQSRYYSAEIGRFINTDDTQIAIATQGEILGANLFAYCNNNPIVNTDRTGFITPANVVGALIAGALGAVGGYFLSKWLANKLNLSGWKRTAFIAGLTAVITATAAVIGYFIGPYIQKVAKSIIKSLKTLIKTVDCFVAGTEILTEEGLVPIEKVKVGDLVWAENPETGETELKPIVQVFVNETNELVHLVIDSEDIYATPGHKFYVEGKGWTSAIELEPGDNIPQQDGDFAIVYNAFLEQRQNPITIYNFEVAEFHTYYVGEVSILVHNRNCQTVAEVLKQRKGSVMREFPSQFKNSTMDEVERLAKQGNKAAKKAWKLLTDGRFKK